MDFSWCCFITTSLVSLHQLKQKQFENIVCVVKININNYAEKTFYEY